MTWVDLIQATPTPTPTVVESGHDVGELGWEFLKAAITIPITIASAWVAFRWATRQRDVDAWVAAARALRAEVYAVRASVDQWVADVEAERPVEPYKAYSTIAAHTLAMLDHVTALRSTSRRLSPRWRRVAGALAEHASSDVVLFHAKTLKSPARGDTRGMWALDWAEAARDHLGPSANVVSLWSHYQTIGPRAALRQHRQFYGDDSVPRYWPWERWPTGEAEAAEDWPTGPDGQNDQSSGGTEDR